MMENRTNEINSMFENLLINVEHYKKTLYLTNDPNDEKLLNKINSLITAICRSIQLGNNKRALLLMIILKDILMKLSLDEKAKVDKITQYIIG